MPRGADTGQSRRCSVSPSCVANVVVVIVGPASFMAGECRTRGNDAAGSSQPLGLYATTSISTLASTISLASVVERAGRPFLK